MGAQGLQVRKPGHAGLPVSHKLGSKPRNLGTASVLCHLTEGVHQLCETIPIPILKTEN